MGGRRFGPRGGTTIVKVGFDASLAEDLAQINAKRAAMFANMPRHKRELASYNAGKKSAERSRAGRAERQESERRMVEAVRKVVEILETHMIDLMQHRSVGHSLVNQLQIHNIIVLLRTKSGVQFDDGSEFSRPVKLDEQHLKRGQSQPDDFERASERFFEERAKRDAAFRRVTDRLIARGK